MKDAMATDIMERIKQGKVRMHPRWYFIAMSMIAAFITGILAFVMAYAMSMVYLAIRIQLGDRPMYGARFKLDSLINDFPWILVLFVAVACIALVLHLRRTSRLYRLRPSVLVLVIMGVSALLALLIAISPLSVIDHSEQPSGRQGHGYGRSVHNK